MSDGSGPLVMYHSNRKGTHLVVELSRFTIFPMPTV